MSTFRALTTNVSVEIREDVPLAAVAQAIIRSYPPADNPTLSYRLSADGLLRNDELLVVEDPHDLVPLFEMDLYEQLVARADPGWILHAAALEVNGRALVLCGASGAGKTTMALNLTSRGFRLLTEEVVWIDRVGTVRGLPRPLHVSAGSPQRARIPSAWTQLPYPLRGRDGVVRDNVLVVPPAGVFQRGGLRLLAIIRIGHGRDWSVHLQPSRHHVALQRLWDRSLRQDDAGLETATAMLRQYTSYELSSTTEAEAEQLLEQLLKRIE